MIAGRAPLRAPLLTLTLTLTIVAGAGCSRGSAAQPSGREPTPAPALSAPRAGAAMDPPTRGFDERLLAGARPGVIAGQVLDGDDRPAQSCVVYVKNGLPPAKYTPPAQPLVIDQRDKAFAPRVAAVLAGTTVEFRNDDVVLHNVYSRSPTKTFDLGAYGRQTPRSTRFDAPGRVDVFCAIHANMHAVVLVLDNPFFTSTDSRGYFELGDLPAGGYGLEILCDQQDGQSVHAQLGADRAAVVRVKLP